MQTICGVMKDGLKNLAIDYNDKLVATGTDGASSMLFSVCRKLLTDLSLLACTVMVIN